MNLTNIYCTDTDYTALDIYTYKIINNVSNYALKDFNKWEIMAKNDNNIDNTNVQYYLIIETEFNDAFGHWVFESAIYLPLYNLLKKIYNNIKIHFISPRNFKYLFCRYFNIGLDNISTTFETSNICIFPLPIAPLNNNTISDLYKQYVRQFIYNFNSLFTNNCKITKNLFLPRGKKELYIGNKRYMNTSDIEEYFIKNNTDNVLYYTDDTENITDQINMLIKSKNIIITDGSAFIVNGVFCQNSNIIVLGNVVVHQANCYVKMKYILDIISENNNVIFIPYIHGDFYNSIFYYDDISNYIT